MHTAMTLKDRVRMHQAAALVQHEAINTLRAEAAAAQLAGRRLREAAEAAVAAMRAAPAGGAALAAAADALAAALDAP